MYRIIPLLLAEDAINPAMLGWGGAFLAANVIITLLLTKGVEAWQKMRDQHLKEKESERKSKQEENASDRVANAVEVKQIEDGLRLYIEKQESRLATVEGNYTELLKNYQHCIEEHAKEQTARGYLEIRVKQLEARAQ